MKKEEVLKLIQTREWTSAATPVYLIFCYGWMHGFMRTRNYFPRYLSDVWLLIKDGLGFEIAEEKQMIENIKQLYDDPAASAIRIAEWVELRDAFFKTWGSISAAGLQGKDDAKLGALFECFTDEMVETWAAPLVSDLMGLYTERELLTALRSHLPENDRANADEYFAVLSQPAHLSFVGKERVSILSLSLLKKKSDPSFEVELKKHKEAFFWVKNTYRYIQILDEDFFLKEIEAIEDRDAASLEKERKELETSAVRAEEERKKLVERLRLPRGLKDKLILTPLLGVWLDERKEYNLRSNHLFNQFLEEIARRAKVLPEELYSMLPHEVIRLLLKKERVSTAEIQERQKRSVYVTSQPETGTLFSGEDGSEIIAAFEKRLEEEKTENFKGTVASRGKEKFYEGIVRVVHDAKTADFKEGEILVTSMTRPEFVPLMRKARCIVTDEGGIASHAAIISRELGIPCVIGTKVATKILKDGDRVKIDIEKGTVRRV